MVALRAECSFETALEETSRVLLGIGVSVRVSPASSPISRTHFIGRDTI